VNIQSELLLDIIRRVEETETSWPSCAPVCESWRAVTQEIVQTPEECGRLTFPISLNQLGPCDSPIQCFIRRDRETSAYLLYYGLVPLENETDKMLLAAKKIRKTAGTDLIISMVAVDFSRSSNAYVGKLRSNILGTKFTIYDIDRQPPHGSGIQPNSRSSRRFLSRQVSPRVQAYNYIVSTIPMS
jgi:tubby and related proteins